jgi:hypothetical protein
MKRVMGAILAVASLSGCGSPPLRQWIVASVSNQVQAGPSASCGAVPDNTALTYGNADALWSMYQGDDTHYYLDRGDGKAIEGTLTGGIYSFAYSTLEDDTDPADQPKWETKHVVNVSIKLTPDGTKVKGSYTFEDKTTCDNLQSNQDACLFRLPKVIDCIQTGNIQGAELDSPKWVRASQVPTGSGPSQP